jgi:hypothetical protein
LPDRAASGALFNTEQGASFRNISYVQHMPLHDISATSVDQQKTAASTAEWSDYKHKQVYPYSSGDKAILVLACLLTILCARFAEAETASIMDRVLAEYQQEVSSISSVDALLITLAQEHHPPSDVSPDQSGIVALHANGTSPLEESIATEKAAIGQENLLGSPQQNGPVYLMPGSTVTIEGPQINWVGTNSQIGSEMPTITSMQQDQGKQFVASNVATSSGNVFGAINLGATGVTNTFGDLSTSTIGAVNSGQINITIGTD